LKRLFIHIQGIVQGVGFRPYVHRLATAAGLAGKVWNDSSGVYIEAEGDPQSLQDFLRILPRSVPPLAMIDFMESREIPVSGDSDFRIAESGPSTDAFTPVSPDIATCEDCLAELFDPDDRRYRYPFINCTNCGPRYTIIHGLPYDRPLTTMAAFTMCPACEGEYFDPANRRFHAQPNACPVCGPRCELRDNQGNRVPGADPVLTAIERLREGAIVAVKGIGGFHLAVRSADEDAVQRLRKRKRRDEKPFALMARSLEEVRRIAAVGPGEEILLLAPQRPIVLVEKRPDAPVAASISPRNRYFGVMLPYTPLHHLLLADPDLPCLVMTSGNFSEEPIITGNRRAMEVLAPIADFFLWHNRDILVRNDDSITRSFGRQVYFLRRSRGYAPAPVRLKKKYPPVLAVGAELKNTVALNSGNYAFVSQHIGDLENSEVFSSFETTAAHLQALYKIQPEVLAYDLHPEYLSTKYALSRQDELPLRGVQHHHAHVASCLAEHQVDETVIGISFDGTGYGLDGRIWGGEVLAAGLVEFERLCHFEYVPMPGGSRAIREPWRMAVSYLHLVFGPDWRNVNLPFLRDIEAGNLDLIGQIITRRINCPETSSCGRLFDGFAALSGLRLRNTFEGQAAMELEMSLDDTGVPPGYPFPRQDGQIRLSAAVRAAVEDVLAGRPASFISARLHRGLVETLADLCEEIRSGRGLQTVVLSGGVFQNLWLLEHLSGALQRRKFTVLTHHLIPCNDGGISLGQLVVAGERQLAGLEEPCVWPSP
jgi:hydrogenase maturation protein HypF